MNRSQPAAAAVRRRNERLQRRQWVLLFPRRRVTHVDKPKSKCHFH